MGNSSSATNHASEGITTRDNETGEQVINFDFFSDVIVNEHSNEEIEESQVDHFNVHARLEQLRKELGEEMFKERKEQVQFLKQLEKNCHPFMIGKPSDTAEHTALMIQACVLREYTQHAPLIRDNKFKCLDDRDFEEIIHIDKVMKSNPTLANQKFKEFGEDLEYCLTQHESNIFQATIGFMGWESRIKEPYSAIFTNPITVEIMKSRYLPNETPIGKQKIESELIEPYVFNPKTDSESDGMEKFRKLSQSPLLKNDIELVRQCYSSRLDEKEKCFELYSDIIEYLGSTVCKQQMLLSQTLKFPNIEDAAYSDFDHDCFCRETLQAKYALEIFPEMTEFHSRIFI